jgi:cellulose synthase/poly-beta-1,6-N-acetylglucosamine synthase-like glycosyltransferase
MTEILTGANTLIFFYYLQSNLVYLGLLITAILSSIRYQRQLGLVRLERVRVSPLAPPISLLVPAHNEAKSIVGSIDSLLGLDYPEFEVIVANDGSTDDTMAVLKARYQLLETDMLYIPEVPSRPVRAVYMSQVEPRLW